MNYKSINKYINALKENNLFTASDINTDFDVLYTTYNSKACIDGTLFVCKGAAFKEDYLFDAINNGAICYISETKFNADIPYILVSDIRKAMPILADLYYDSPYKAFKITGITGTKGKSTTAYYLKSILDEYTSSINEAETAVISSIDVYDGVNRYESHITTPESMELFEHFNNAKISNIKYLNMEVSSQALKYNRVDNIEFDCGVFLNISEDHISDIEHKDFDDYFHSKLKIFALCKKAFICADSDNFDEILSCAKTSKEVIIFGREGSKYTGAIDVYGYNIKKTNEGTSFMVKTNDFDTEFLLTMPGLFNVENALAAIAVCLDYNIPLDIIKEGIKKARSSGRMELYKSNDGNIIAVVDYAHNKLSFETLFSSTKTEFPDYNIVSIFGCPGYKALVRRRDLGLIAGEYSKKVYICAEDPGKEPVIDISKEIASYVEKSDTPYEIIENRGDAIKKAIDDARLSGEKTILLITGKGNETRQKYGTEYIDCPSDTDYVLKYLN